MESLLTVEELRAYLRIGRAHAYRLIHNRAIPSYKVGRCVRVRKADVDAYLERCQR